MRRLLWLPICVLTVACGAPGAFLTGPTGGLMPPDRQALIVVNEALISEVVAPRTPDADGYVYSDEVNIPGNAPTTGQLRFIVDLNEVDRLNPAVRVEMLAQRLVPPSEVRDICGYSGQMQDYFDDELGEPFRPWCSVGMSSFIGDGQGGKATRTKRGWRVRLRMKPTNVSAFGWRVQVVTEQ